MGFPVKDWVNDPDTTTPVSAAALEDVEARLAAYAEGVSTRGNELGYAEITSNFTQTGVGASDVTGLSTTVTVGVRPIMVRFETVGLSNSSASGIAVAEIYEGSTLIGSGAVLFSTSATTVSRSIRRTPSAGAHTYKITLTQVVTGNSVISASSDNSAYIQVVEV